VLRNIFIIATMIIYIFANQFSLKDAQHTINISVNSVDIQEVLDKTIQKAKQIDFAKLKVDDKSIKIHTKRVAKIEENLKLLASYRSELELDSIDIKSLKISLQNAQQQYNRDINRIYKKNHQIDRYTYIVVATKGELDYNIDLENFLIDKYAIKLYDQTTTLHKSLQSVQMKSIIKTQKDFGQKSIDVIYEYPLRANNITLRILKVIQNPFVKPNLNKKQSSNVAVYKNQALKESTSKIYDLNDINIDTIKNDLLQSYHLPVDAIRSFVQEIKTKTDLQKQKNDFVKNTNKITAVLNQLETQHKKELRTIVNINEQYQQKKAKVKQLQPKIDKLLEQTQLLLKPYDIKITKETIGAITIIDPKLYKERVDLNEEVDYIRRKIKSYITKITVSDIQQSDTLIDFDDLLSITTKKHKVVKYNTISFLPYLTKDNKIALFVFASVSIKDKLDENDLTTFGMKYTTLKFIPVKQGYKTIFAGQTEVTLALVKEYLETHSFKKTFDSYCLDESLLPEEAKDYKNITSEYYNYPAVCFKVDKIDKFLEWVSKKIKRQIILPTSKDWGYVASNANSTTYCWGDESVEDLASEDELPENIYIEDKDEDTTISQVAKYKKSKLGLYDMCGNVFELTKDEDGLTYKGNSFSSYIEESVGEGEEYSDDINPSLGLRLFYIKDLTNE